MQDSNADVNLLKCPMLTTKGAGITDTLFCTIYHLPSRSWPLSRYSSTNNFLIRSLLPIILSHFGHLIPAEPAQSPDFFLSDLLSSASLGGLCPYTIWWHQIAYQVMSEAIRKRRRPALSCAECRRRKIKCDRNDVSRIRPESGFLRCYSLRTPSFSFCRFECSFFEGFFLDSSFQCLK